MSSSWCIYIINTHPNHPPTHSPTCVTGPTYNYTGAWFWPHDHSDLSFCHCFMQVWILLQHESGGLTLYIDWGLRINITSHWSYKNQLQSFYQIDSSSCFGNCNKHKMHAIEILDWWEEAAAATAGFSEEQQEEAAAGFSEVRVPNWGLDSNREIKSCETSIPIAED